jgi:uncharacterized membrane protein HdeD (DUF308 family)
MSVGFPYFLSPDRREMESLFGKSLWVAVLGAGLIVVGLLALLFPTIASVETATVFGILLLVGGALQVGTAFWAKGWGGFFVNLVVGLFYVFVGCVFIDRPLIAAVELTLVLAVFLIGIGLFRFIFAAGQRYSGWGWGLLNGVVTLLLGILIWRHWPGDGPWVIGTLVGIELLFSGWSLVMLGLAVRSVSKPSGAVTAAS